MNRYLRIFFNIFLFIFLFSCTRKTTEMVRIDGSSTVFPITEAVAEEYQKQFKNKVIIGVSGTGGGFQKFCRGKTDITGASRTIKPSEVKLCKENGVAHLEVPVAFDGIAIVVHPSNTWVEYLTVDELKKMFEPKAQGRILSWSQIRKGFPNKPLHLFSPGVDSGTYDYFTEVVVGKTHSSRGDLTSSEDDNVLVHGISKDKFALGFFGFAYYIENKDKLKVVPVVPKGKQVTEAVLPTFLTIKNNQYTPLSRPIFNYVAIKSLDKPAVKTFMNYYLKEGKSLVEEVGYIPLPDDKYKNLLAKVDRQQ